MLIDGEMCALMQKSTEESSKAVDNAKWKSHFRSLLVHTAQATHLDALFGVHSSLPVAPVTPAIDMAPFVGLPPHTQTQVRPMSVS